MTDKDFKTSDFWFKAIGVLITIAAAVFAAGAIMSENASVKIRVDQLESGDREIARSIREIENKQTRMDTNLEWIVKQMGGTPAK